MLDWDLQHQERTLLLRLSLGQHQDQVYFKAIVSRVKENEILVEQHLYEIPLKVVPRSKDSTNLRWRPLYGFRWVGADAMNYNTGQGKKGMESKNKPTGYLSPGGY